MHGYVPLDKIRGFEWSPTVTDPTAIINSAKDALAIMLKDTGKALQREASDWVGIVELGVKERMGGQISGVRLVLLLEQARTSMQLAAANQLVEKEAAILTAIQNTILTAAKLAI